jgi:hypothetical protein
MPRARWSVRGIRRGPAAGPASLSVMLMLVLSAHAIAAEPVTIARLLADPQPYHMKVVTLHGTSHQVQALRDAPRTLPQLDFQCYFAHPPYTFVLADETGFLQITVRGRPPCVSKHAPAQPPDVAEGTRVSIDVQITVTGDYRAAAPTPAIEALAIGIRRVDD